MMIDGERWVWLFDIHAEAVPTGNGKWKPNIDPSLWAALDFCKDFQPHGIGIGGDFIHLDHVGRWSKNKPRLREGRRLRYDYALGNQILDVIDEIKPGKKVFLIGNHDVWLEKWLDEHPQVEGLVELEPGLKLKEREYEVIPENQVYRIGKANFVHGWYWTLHHSKKHVIEMGDNIFYGHVHDMQCFTKTNYDQQPIMGHSCGCLCNVNPEYKKDAPNRWVNGFGVFYFSKNGNFTPYFPVIIKGEFWWGGKKYGGK